MDAVPAAPAAPVAEGTASAARADRPMAAQAQMGVEQLRAGRRMELRLSAHDTTGRLPMADGTSSGRIRPQRMLLKRSH